MSRRRILAVVVSMLALVALSAPVAAWGQDPSRAFLVAGPWQGCDGYQRPACPRLAGSVLGEPPMAPVTGLATAADGSVLVATSRLVHRLDPAGRLSTVGGGGQSRADGVSAFDAGLAVRGVAALDGGAYVVADQLTHRIRHVSAQGVITTVAGTGRAGSARVGAPAAATPLTLYGQMIGLLPAGERGLLFTEPTTDRVRLVTRDGTLTTFAGTGRRGSSGDGGPATRATLSEPMGLTALQDGIVAVVERSGYRIRQIAPDGTITTISAWHPRRNPVLRAPTVPAVRADGALVVGVSGDLARILPDGQATSALPPPWPVTDHEGDFAGRYPRCTGAVTATRDGGVLLADDCDGELWWLAPPDTSRGLIAIRNTAPAARSVSATVELTQPGSVELRLMHDGETVATATSAAMSGTHTLSVPRRSAGWHLLRANWTVPGQASATDDVRLFLGSRLPQRLARRAFRDWWESFDVIDSPPGRSAGLAGCHRLTARRIDCHVRGYGRGLPPRGVCSSVRAFILARTGVIWQRGYECARPGPRPYRLRPRWSELGTPVHSTVRHP